MRNIWSLSGQDSAPLYLEVSIYRGQTPAVRPGVHLPPASLRRGLLAWREGWGRALSWLWWEDVCSDLTDKWKCYWIGRLELHQGPSPSQDFLSQSGQWGSFSDWTWVANNKNQHWDWNSTSFIQWSKNREAGNWFISRFQPNSDRHQIYRRGLPRWLSGEESTCRAGMQVWSLGWEDPLEKEMATHSSMLAREIPWTEELGGLQSMGSQKSQTWLSD